MSGSKQTKRTTKPAARAVEANQQTPAETHSESGTAADAGPQSGATPAGPVGPEAQVSGSTGDGQNNPRAGGDDPSGSDSNEPAPEGEPSKPRIIPVLYVQAARGVARFRRAGMTFGPARERLARETLSDEQVEALLNEPNLVVSEDSYEVGSED